MEQRPFDRSIPRKWHSCWGTVGNFATSSSAQLMYCLGALHMVDNGGDTSASHCHPHSLQMEGVRAALGLPPEDQELMLNWNRVHGAVFLPFSIEAALVPASGLYNKGGNSMAVLGNTARRADKSGR